MALHTTLYWSLPAAQQQQQQQYVCFLFWFVSLTLSLSLSLSLSLYDSLHTSFVTHTSHCRTARLLLEIHFKEQIKFMNDMARLNKVRENLFEVQGEVASGQRIEFYIPLELIGVSIGKGGARIKEVRS